MMGGATENERNLGMTNGPINRASQIHTTRPDGSSFRPFGLKSFYDIPLPRERRRLQPCEVIDSDSEGTLPRPAFRFIRSGYGQLPGRGDLTYFAIWRKGERQVLATGLPLALVRLSRGLSDH